MHPYPHNYRASARSEPESAVEISGQGLPAFSSMPPAEFGGPGDQWSPETLLVAAVSDCIILTFKAIARASALKWTQLECETDGVLDRVDGVTRFTQLKIHAHLTIPRETDEHKAQRILEKSEAVCLISNSLSAEKHLKVIVDFED